MKLLIIGAGNFAKEIERMAQLQGYDEIAYLDNNKKTAKCFPVIGGLDEIESFAGSYSHALVAIGNNNTRKKYLSRLKDFQIPVLVDPSAQVSPNAHIGAGSIIKADSVIKAEAVLGMGVVLNDGSVIEQGCQVGDCCSFLPYAGLSNRIKLEPCSWIDGYTMVE